ncbi:hypothetical protein LXA43DRAFT_1063869 [Ganoderma leucocontextum]|nr:hypothetical protein LXA43DRAFT_1063869 [Ganoderma leucocontextum]
MCYIRLPPTPPHPAVAYATLRDPSSATALFHLSRSERLQPHLQPQMSQSTDTIEERELWANFDEFPGGDIYLEESNTRVRKECVLGPVMPSSPSHAGDSATLVPVATTKRGPGRPKGAKNKKTLAASAAATPSDSTDPTANVSLIKHGLGRPRGTGPKQLERQAAVAARIPPATTEKRAPGRPKKENGTGVVHVNVVQHKLHPPGTATSSAYTVPVCPDAGPNVGPISSVVRFLYDHSALQNCANTGSSVRGNPLAPSTSDSGSSPPSIPLTSSASSECSVSSTPFALPAAEISPPVFDILIPEDDPTRSFELTEPDEQDEYMGLVQDGLGEEDDHPGIQGDVDVDPGEVNAGASDLAQEMHRQSRTRPLPPWLMTAFKARLDESRERGPDKLPPLYRTGTLWFPQRSTYFVLRQQHPSPQALFEPHFFLWDPLALHEIACPYCRTRLDRNSSIKRSPASC